MKNEKDKKAIWVIGILTAISFFLLTVVGCAGGNWQPLMSSAPTAESTPTEESPTPTKYYKACNVLLRTKFAQAEDNEKIFAEQVIYDPTKSAIQSFNVQSALDEIEPKLSDIIDGTWDLEYKKLKGLVGNDGKHFEVVRATITFDKDGTFEPEGSMEAFGWLYCNEFKKYIPHRWEVSGDEIAISYVLTGEYAGEIRPFSGKIIKIKKNVLKIYGYQDVKCIARKREVPTPSPTPSLSP